MLFDYIQSRVGRDQFSFFHLMHFSICLSLCALFLWFKVGGECFGKCCSSAHQTQRCIIWHNMTSCLFMLEEPLSITSDQTTPTQLWMSRSDECMIVILVHCVVFQVFALSSWGELERHLRLYFFDKYGRLLK